jgi:protease I
MNAYPACAPEVVAGGCEFVSLQFHEAVTDGNLVTGPAWTAHVEWIKQFLDVLGTKIVHGESSRSKKQEAAALMA